MNILSIILSYLPAVLGTVVAVEQSIKAPGATKAEVVLSSIQQASKVVGETVPESHVQLITGLIDSVVGVLNQTGVFTRSTPERPA